MNEPLFSVEAALPFAWQTVEAESMDCQDTQQSNHLLLKALNALEIPEPGEQSKAQERLESKLDLMLLWLGQVLHGKAGQPEKQTLRLDNDGISWQVADPVAEGSMVKLALYPSSQLGAPLQLWVRVVSHHGASWVRGAFCCQDEGFQNEWSQWLFRRHRREIQAHRGSHAK